MSVLNWIWLWWDAASWLRIPQVLKIDSWEKLLNMIKKRLKMELKDSNWDYKRWPLIISRVIRIACILIKTLIPHKYSFEFCLGFWTMKIPTPYVKMRIFSIYMAALKWTYPCFEPHGSTLGFWKSDILHENPEILADF